MSRADPSQFVHLHTHSHYSLLEALPKIEELVAAAKKDGQIALALTDSGNLYGAIDFYKECKSNGIKPIIGVELHVAPRTRHDKEHKTDENTSRVVLLAKNTLGYHNLIKIVSFAHLEGFHYTPRADKELLETYAEGIVCILPAFYGDHAKALREQTRERALESLHFYKKIFGEDVYVEVTHHPELDGHESLMQNVATLCKEVGVPLVATHENYYLDKDDALARELVNKVRTGSTLNRDFGAGLADLSFHTQKQVQSFFKNNPDAVANSLAIAEKCNLEIELGKWVFPDFPRPDGKTHDQMLHDLAYAGLVSRGMPDTPEIRKRIDYELSVICSKGYPSYFLVMADLLREARARGILTNTRGSAAGSLVSYLCGITTIDPLAFNMPFERFLNPERPSPPDIDLDLADNKRDELIDYIRATYGEKNVAQIGTFGTLLSRAAVRDVSRALGHPYGVGDRIAKMIPAPKQGFPITIEKALKEVKELKELYDGDADAREILDLASKVEGNARHVGVHAAGVFITPKPVFEYVPIQRDPKGGKTITQYDMYSAGEDGLGLLKFDLLGLKNLSVLADSIARVKARLNVDIEIEKLRLDDEKVYAMLSRGETLGVFQFASSGMTAYLAELRPNSIHDLNAMVALYRPGPIAFIPTYIERKRNPNLVTYLDPRLEPILKDTYGILIYQDDLLLVAAEIAGYTLGEADKFRRAVGKKIPAEMAAQKERFIKGAIDRGMKPAVANKLWEQIETFAAYGFNKAHAASYGNLAYKTAYMKANFPVDYMAAVLTADAGDVEKIAEIVAECKKMGIKVWPPDVNESRGDFTVVGEKDIRFGLYSIKNFGEGVGDAIIIAREAGGPFVSIADFCTRVDSKNLNRKGFEALIKSGAMDAFGERGELLGNLETLLSMSKEGTGRGGSSMSLFGGAISAPTVKLHPFPPAPMEDRLAWEKELLGLYVSGHPLDKYKEKFEKQKFNIKATKERLKGVDTVIAGFVESAQTILTKNGEKMSFIKLADLSDSVEVVAFPRILKEFDALLSPGSCIMLKGKISERHGEASFIAEKVKPL